MRTVRMATFEKYGGYQLKEEVDFYGHETTITEFKVFDDVSADQIYKNLPYFDDVEELEWWATIPPLNKTEWLDVAHNRGKKCAICGFRIRNKNAIITNKSYYKYCPHCGSEMGKYLENYCELSKKEWNEPVDYNNGLFEMY